MKPHTSRPANIGRPKRISIRGDRVAGLRNNLGLSQGSLAKSVYAAQGKDRRVTDAALRQRAYRWESGKVANTDLEPLAKVLKSTVTYLQGGAPEPEPDRIMEIEEQLHRQLQVGNRIAHKAVERERKSDHTEDDARLVRSVAEWIGASLEAAQLTRSQPALQYLLQIMGWDETQTRAPANTHGMWLLAKESRFGSTAEIVHGLSRMSFNLHKEITEWLKPGAEDSGRWICSDARIVFREESPWFRVHMLNPNMHHRDFTLSFVRGEPSDAGVKWTKAASLDRMFIEDIPHNLWTKSNFIVAFNQPDKYPSLRNMRLLIERIQSLTMDLVVNTELSPDTEIVSVVEGDLDDLTDSTFESFQSEGFSHAAVISFLRTGLWPALAPHMEQWPRDCWTIHPYQAKIAIRLSPTYRAAYQLGRKQHGPHYYFIRLVELRDTESLHPLPWRDDSVQETLKYLQDHLEKLPILGPSDNFICPPRPPDLSSIID
jgi:transcriptional regulator with XRE-family HTH domain